MSPPAPFILVSAALARDGVARNTINLAKALARRGAPVQVVSLESGPLAAELDGLPHIRLGRAPGPRPLALALAAPALAQHLARTRPAAVVSMGNHAHLAVWAALRGLPHLPRVYRISNDPFHAGEGPFQRLLREGGLRLIARDATRLVSVSAAAAQRPVFDDARRLGRLEVIPNGVDAALVRARAAAACKHPWLTDGRPFLVAVGRLHRQKNCEALIEALAILRAHGRRDLRLLILGRGGAATRARLTNLARDLGVAHAVRLEGEVENPFPLVARAAAYVLPSRWEGASNSLLEAMACGVPVVAAVTAGSAPEVLAAGRYGALAEPEPTALARVIAAQLDPASRVLPKDRAADYDLAKAVEAMCRLVLAAPGLHDEIQMRPEAARHPGPVEASIRGPIRSTDR
ncbi:glycosyltransferase [Phenylobacterium sp. VNQ135]|uniref:glycosyltransferase n=1 Tax=Phenylobacterium sp. VNQ135 TaxID=3400922 RepID=UPI003C0B84AB